jgi:N-acetylglucosaminyl-diphospho-decaprenol L-rhamnosyltransferase
MSAADGAVSIVAVTYSPGDTLAPFLDSLAGATTRPYRVVLADNGSTDGLPQQAADDRPEVTFAPTGGNLGYGQGANFGIALTDTDFVVVANPDLRWSPGSLDALVDAAARWPGAASWGPLIRTEDGEIYPSARELPDLLTGIGHALCARWWPGNPWSVRYRREHGPLDEGPVGWLSGACLLLRRSAFDAVDGFSADYFMYFEDTDLGARLAKAGWLNVYVPTAEVVHEGGHSTSRQSSAMLAEHHRSAWQYLSSQYRGWRWAPVRLVLRVGLAARSFLAIRANDRSPQLHQDAGA